MEKHFRMACMADTPLHLLNLLSFVYYDVEGSRGACDLYLHHQFSGYEHIEEALRATGLFARVIECRLPRESSKGRPTWGHALSRLPELLFPGLALRRLTGTKVKRNAYDVLLLPAPNRLSVILRDRDPAADVWLYEEGSASYFSNILDVFGPKYKYLLKALLHRGHAMIQPTRLYVHNLAMCESTVPCEKYPLPPLDAGDTGFRAVLESVFGALPELQGARLIYLSTPPELIVTPEDMDAAQIEKDVLDVLRPYADGVLVRPHPKEGERSYQGLPVDRRNALWELLCATQLTDEHVLLGNFSTAQMMPKLLFDKEPTLIFTWRLYKTPLSRERKEGLEALLEHIRGAYRTPEKVFDVSSVEELREVIGQVFRQKRSAGPEV